MSEQLSARVSEELNVKKFPAPGCALAMEIFCVA